VVGIKSVGMTGVLLVAERLVHTRLSTKNSFPSGGIRSTDAHDHSPSVEISIRQPWVLSDEGLTPTKDGGTCLRRLSMFRKEVH